MEAKDIISSGLLELYATGLASRDEVLQVEQAVRQFPEVAAELEAIQSGMEAYAQAHALQPADTVKEKIFSQIAQQEKPKVVSIATGHRDPKLYDISSYWKWAAAASVLLLLGSVAVNVLFYNKYNQASKDLEQTQLNLASIEQSNKAMKEDMSVVQSKYSEPVALHGLTVAPDAAAKIFWMKNTGDVYIDPSNLPDIPQGKQFQLWAIVDGKPVDAGMVVTSKKGEKYRIQKMKSFGKAEAFAITIEKEGGSPTPTMDQMVVMGKL